MIWIIGGTCEALKIIKRIEGKVDYIVTIATKEGKEMFEDAIASRLNKEDMIDFIKKNNIDLIADISHPYAFEVSKNAKYAAKECKIKYLRYVREKTDVDIKDIILFNSYEECFSFLQDIKGCVFITTGTKNIKDFERIKKDNRFVYRILPSVESIEKCKKYNISMKNIIAALGPFSVELNRAMFKEYGADYVVMKDSGKEGGTKEKIIACRQLNISPLVIGRKDEEGISEIDKIVEVLLRGEI